MTNAPYSEGSFDSSICLIGEAPGENEERLQRPFVGKAGQLLDGLLSRTGIIRADCRLDNVFQFRPYDNNLRPYIDLSKKVPFLSDKYKEHLATLKERLEKCTANVLVPLGNIPLYSLTGLKDITKRRGSILESTLLPGRKVIPTIHPSAALRMYEYQHFIAHDLERIKKNMSFPEIRLLKRDLILSPLYVEALAYISSCHKYDLIAADIEVKWGELSHISLATDPESAICIPFVDGARPWFTPDQEADVMLALADLLEDESVAKIGHHMFFDSSFLFQKYGIRTRPTEDTMVATAIVTPEFPKKLEFVTSIYCDGEPYYKDERKMWMNNPFGDEEAFRRYSALDSVVCIEAFHRLMDDVERLDNKETYKRQKGIIEPLVFMASKGLRVDAKSITKEGDKADLKIKEMTKQFQKLCGKDINPNSPAQVCDYFYNHKGIKPYTKKGSPTTDKNALKRLARAGHPEARILLDIRHYAKLKGTYFDIELDDDGRLRCSYNPVGTVSGRISSSKTIFNKGGNLQNQPPEMKRFIIADEGYIFVSIDLGQAENRVVAYIANEPRMIEAFENKVDVHKLTASFIFNKKVDEVSDKPGSCNIGGGIFSERFWGKKANHGLNYGEGYKTFALDYEIPERDAKFIVERYHGTYPGVRQWHTSIRELLSRDRRLTNCYNRTRVFTDRWGNDLFKSAYSFIPQSTVADKISDGLTFAYERQDMFKNVDLLNQIHDSIIFEFPLARGSVNLARCLMALRENLESLIQWKDRSFSIPADISVGFNLDKSGSDNPLGMKEVESNNINDLAERIEEVISNDYCRRIS